MELRSRVQVRAGGRIFKVVLCFSLREPAWRGPPSPLARLLLVRQNASFRSVLPLSCPVLDMRARARSVWKVPPDRPFPQPLGRSPLPPDDRVLRALARDP